MGFFGKIREMVTGRARFFQAIMALGLLLCAVCFAREGFWETVSGRAAGSRETLIILDAGHGGNDPGKIGVDGVLEKELNLQIAKKVEKLLRQQDKEVLMTRESDKGLYEEHAANKKVQDMRKRCEIMNEEQPACVVSIHQNSYHEEAIHGAQVFYYGTSAESRRLAEFLQAELIKVSERENRREAKANDTYYLLKKTKAPIVIVECGFLSNWQESGRLQEEDYQDEIAWAVHLGILKYLNEK